MNRTVNVLSLFALIDLSACLGVPHQGAGTPDHADPPAIVPDTRVISVVPEKAPLPGDVEISDPNAPMGCQELTASKSDIIKNDNGTITIFYVAEEVNPDCGVVQE